MLFTYMVYALKIEAQSRAYTLFCIAYPCIRDTMHGHVHAQLPVRLERVVCVEVLATTSIG